ncbi:MAG: hypothetical protein ACRDKZ_11860 [Actinomycetota bacterium]
MSRHEALAARSADETAAPVRETGPGRADNRLENIANLLTTYVAPATALGALVFYFGWTYTRAFWLYFAIDPTILGFANQDYVLRSVNALFPALLFMAALAAGAPPLMRFTDRTLMKGMNLTRGARTGVALAGFAAFALGVIALFRGEVYVEVVSPILLGLGTLLLGWTRHLRRVFGAGSKRSLLESMAFWALITLSVFWAISDFARVSGRGAARFTGQNLQARPAVTVFSVEPLGLEGPGLISTVEPADARYRHGYSGLRLLLRTGGRYLLLPEDWEPGGTVFVIDEDPTLRFEFSLPRTSSP